jgi:hypothetical protein
MTGYGVSMASKMVRETMTTLGMALAVTAVMATSGCASTGGATPGAGPDPLAAMPEVSGALVQMRRGGCAPDKCPVYGVSIFMDGTVAYDGRANVATLGQRRTKLSPEQVSELISAIDTMRFLDTADLCCVCPTADRYRSQMVILDYRPGSMQKTVLHDDECRSAPPAMSALEDTIDRLANVSHWTEPVMASGVSATDHLR